MAYPLIILRTPYSGVYEGGLWAALVCEPQDLPKQALGNDLECAFWWREYRDGIGLGATPDEALAALLAIPEAERWAPRSAWYHPSRLGLTPAPPGSG